ncbi:hypothetical protein G9A89_011173 [Geosiphon pyriformis]|nr:hypothetical protein G9A89_011173 [Geosiphon pyriformis]
MVDIEINLDKTETIVIQLSKRKSVLVEPLKFGLNKQTLRLLDPSTGGILFDPYLVQE